MASVHLARQPALDREVALKELHSVHVADAAAAHRFLRESRVAGALNHPSVVTMIEYFEHDSVPFIAMEYLEGGSLRPLVGRLSLAQVAGVLDSMLGGLAEAASREIVHRDLKPENVLVTADGHAKVADFGIAKAMGQVCLTDFRTATGQIVGTPAYMAPEQISGGEITPQVDLYATGLIAYELLAGRHPFHGTDAPMALLMHHVSDEPPPLASLRPDLPPGVVAWVHAMLAKEPGTRPAGAAHAGDWLEGVVCDALGPRWRRDATLPGPGTTPAPEPAARSDMSGIYPIVLPTLAPATSDPVQVASPVVAPQPIPAATEPEPVRARPLVAEPDVFRTEPLVAEPDPVRVEPLSAAPHTARRPRRRTLAAVLGAVLLSAVAAILYSTAPGTEPRAAQRPPAGPPLERRLREVVAPAVRADARLSSKLSSLDPGDSPAGAQERVIAALPATDAALSAVGVLSARTADERRLRGRAERALRAQTDYLQAVRAALRLQASHSLDRLAARLVSRLKLIETAVPRSSDSVRGVRRLKLWAATETSAIQTPPATLPATPTPTPTPTPVQPPRQPARTAAAAPTATPTPTATPALTAEPESALSSEERARRFQRRRTRLRERLEAAGAL